MTQLVDERAQLRAVRASVLASLNDRIAAARLGAEVNRKVMEGRFAMYRDMVKLDERIGAMLREEHQNLDNSVTQE